MKFIIFVLIAGLCLVSANVIPEDPIEAEPQDFTSILVYALRGLKGINCGIKGVVILKNAAQRFLNEVDSCGAQAANQVLAVIESCKQIIVICDKIIHFNKDICTIEQPDGSETHQRFIVCLYSVLQEMENLYIVTQNTIAQIHTVPDIITDTNTCLKTALRDLENSFLSYPSEVVECSKLKS